MAESITLNESPFDGALVIREDGEPILAVADRAEALYALAVARAWHRAGIYISSYALEAAIRDRFDAR